MNKVNLIKESLDLLEKSDRSVIFQTFDNKIVHVADAAFKKEKVYPKNVVKVIEENFSVVGMPIADPNFRKDLVNFIKWYEEAKQHQPKKMFEKF